MLLFIVGQLKDGILKKSIIYQRIDVLIVPGYICKR